MPARPDPRDWTLAQAPAVAPVLATQKLAGSPAAWPGPSQSALPVSWRVRDQGSTYDCVGYGWAAALEIIWAKSEHKERRFDPVFIVANARQLDRRAPGEATTVSAGLAALRQVGALPEEFRAVTSEPLRYALAGNYRIDAYWRLDTPDPQWGAVDYTASARVMRVLISSGCPAVFGVFIFDEMWTGPDGIIHLPRDATRNYGGHILCGVGHDDGKDCGRSGVGAFRVLNSYGTDWGDQGLGWLPYTYFRSSYTFDCWAATAGRWLQD